MNRMWMKRIWMWGSAVFVLLATLTQVSATTGQDVISPLPTPVEESVVITPEPAKEEIWEVDEPSIYAVLRERLGISKDTLAKANDADIEQIIEQHADRLQMDVYRLIDGELVLVAKGRTKEVPLPLNPYPAPEPVATPAAGVSTVQLSAGSYNHHVYLPLTLRPYAAPEIQNAINKAYQYLFRVSEFESPSYGYVKEYVGYPLWIKNTSRPGDSTYPRLVGHYYQNHSQALGKITWYAVGYDTEFMHVTFEEAYDWNYGSPFIWAHRYYTNYNVRYEVSVRSFSGSENVTLYLRNYQVWQRGESLPKTVNYIATDGYAAHRYTIRHAIMLGQKLFDANYQITQKQRLETTAGAFGFYRDIYDPLFKERTFLPDDFIFMNSAYHDCDFVLAGVESSFFWGVYPNTTNPAFGRYGYESKVCTLGRSAYIALSRQDYLAPALQALHIINKYNNPDHGYANPNYPLNGLPATITPRQMARWLEANAWNGHGIKIWGKDPAYASAVRSNAFMVLETVLGYKYGDTTSRTYADALLPIMMQTQWGLYNDGEGYTDENGRTLRPQHRGGQLLAWIKLDPVQAAGIGETTFAYGLPPRTLLNDIIDAFSMPKEVEGVIPTNSESTLTYIQALRVYLYYKYSIAYPSSKWLP
ncbi:hypothetical protein [Caldilinea sp.]|uniref:hypothetical protein n=1 Tax=Caldilinea sp. TaxID=2293560 RepID=UPI0021DF2DB1|nr:hypothetical protein [Caldilinea sp.]GIV73530.1 MAG: hypothetical protein KatS3mg049_2086 [Caldilinea sp.]